jgi:hypothetical protein
MDIRLAGRYANTHRLVLNYEEAIIDFVHAGPEVATLVARVNMSLPHLKRLSAAITENIKIWEERMQKTIEQPEEPKIVIPQMGGVPKIS